jgi:hypothetical protein
MSDNFETHAEQQNPEDMSMQDLRKLATAYGIRANRDWNKDDFVAAINTRRNRHQSLANVVMDANRGPAPGYARISINNTESGNNLPVPVSVNNLVLKIPRDIPVDVPLEVVEVLNNSKTPVRARNHEGQLVWKDVLSYPFQVLAYTPGVATRNGKPVVKGSSDPKNHSLREKFKEIYERWPKNAEFKEFKDQHMRHKAGLAIASETSAGSAAEVARKIED